MSVNSSTFNSSFLLLSCFRSKTFIYILSALSVATILILSLCLLVFYLGFQRPRSQRSTSYTDVFTYYSTAMQLSELLGFYIYVGGDYINLPLMEIVGSNVMYVTSFGLALFHLLTCVEHYLAVAHPITYLGLRRVDGVRIRNVSAGCVWLLCFGSLVSSYFIDAELYDILYYFLMAFFVLVVSFCSVSVLCALKRPGPGEVSRNQSKQRAFHTILCILGVLLVRFGGHTLCFLLSSVYQNIDICVLYVSAVWLDLPSMLVLPLLFLHRAGKLPWKPNHVSA